MSDPKKELENIIRRGLIHPVQSDAVESTTSANVDTSQEPPPHQEPSHLQPAWLKDEKMFRKTFGRGLAFGPRDRKALFDLMVKYDLSEQTVWQLKLAGCVEQTPKGIEITAPGFIAAFGLTAMLITVLMVLPVWWLLPELAAQAETRLDAIVVSGVAITYLWFTNKVSVQPWLLRRKILLINGLTYKDKIEFERN